MEIESQVFVSSEFATRDKIGIFPTDPAYSPIIDLYNKLEKAGFKDEVRIKYTRELKKLPQLRYMNIIFLVKVIKYIELVGEITAYNMPLNESIISSILIEVDNELENTESKINKSERYLLYKFNMANYLYLLKIFYRQ